MSEIKVLGVLGAGQMGSGIAQVAAAAGLTVKLADASMELGNHEIALKALRAVTLMKNPSPMSRAQAFLKQGVIASTQGDNKKAVFLARKALSEDPSLEDAQRFLAQITSE